MEENHNPNHDEKGHFTTPDNDGGPCNHQQTVAEFSESVRNMTDEQLENAIYGENSMDKRIYGIITGEEPYSGKYDKYIVDRLLSMQALEEFGLEGDAKFVTNELADKAGVDIVMTGDDGTTMFVDVKTRYDDGYGRRPDISIPIWDSNRDGMEDARLTTHYLFQNVACNKKPTGQEVMSLAKAFHEQGLGIADIKRKISEHYDCDSQCVLVEKTKIDAIVSENGLIDIARNLDVGEKHEIPGLGRIHKSIKSDGHTARVNLYINPDNITGKELK